LPMMNGSLRLILGRSLSESASKQIRTLTFSN
jgi:hypothetical protein